MKAINRQGYHLESIHKIKQWLDSDVGLEKLSYYNLRDSIVVQLFNEGVYVGCVITTEFPMASITPELERCIRVKINHTIKHIPLRDLKQRNNGKLYDKAIN